MPRTVESSGFKDHIEEFVPFRLRMREIWGRPGQKITCTQKKTIRTVSVYVFKSFEEHNKYIFYTKVMYSHSVPPPIRCRIENLLVYLN